MNVGAPELVIIFTVVMLLVVGVGMTIWGIVDASQRGQTGWLIGIVVGWAFGVGWLVAIVYLTVIRPGLARASSPPANPFDQGWG